MSALTARRLVWLFVLALAAAPAGAADAPVHNASHALRAATWEPAPPALQGGRFALRAQWQAAPPARVARRAKTLTLHATVAPKSNAAACPLPGVLLSDGFESP